MNRSYPEFGDALVADFLTQIETISWFANIGKALPPESPVQHIDTWDDWKGPEEPSVTAIGNWHASLYEELVEHDGDAIALFNMVLKVVKRNSIPKVPYEPTMDTWYGPNAAVGHAAWTAGLFAVHCLLRRPIPHELQIAMLWYAQGRWPCDWSTDEITEGAPIIF